MKDFLHDAIGMTGNDTKADVASALDFTRLCLCMLLLRKQIFIGANYNAGIVGNDTAGQCYRLIEVMAYMLCCDYSQDWHSIVDYIVPQYDVIDDAIKLVQDALCKLEARQ